MPQDPEAGAWEYVVELVIVAVVAWLEELVAVVGAAVVPLEMVVPGIQAWPWFHHFFPLVRTSLESQVLFQV